METYLRCEEHRIILETRSPHHPMTPDHPAQTRLTVGGSQGEGCEANLRTYFAGMNDAGIAWAMPMRETA